MALHNLKTHKTPDVGTSITYKGTRTYIRNMTKPKTFSYMLFWWMSSFLAFALAICSARSVCPQPLGPQSVERSISMANRRAKHLNCNRAVSDRFFFRTPAIPYVAPHGEKHPQPMVIVFVLWRSNDAGEILHVARNWHGTCNAYNIHKSVLTSCANDSTFLKVIWIIKSENKWNEIADALGDNYDYKWQHH